MEGKYIAMVLSGGGARGIAHIGVIEELQERGYIVNSVVGTSMGSVVGGALASGKLDEFKSWLYTLSKKSVFDLLDFTMSMQGLIKGDRVLSHLQTFIPDEDIENLKLDFKAIAVDINTGKEVVLDKGSLYEAIRSSIAIPTVFTPHKSGNQLLIDGGVLNNLPMKYAMRTDGDILVASDVNALIPFELEKEDHEEDKEKHSIMQRLNMPFALLNSSKNKSLGYVNIMGKTLGLMMNRITELSLLENQPDLLIKISRNCATAYEFYKAEELVEYGRKQAILFLDEYEKAEANK